MDEKLHVFIFESRHRLNELNRLYQQKDYPAMLAEILSLRTAASSFGVVSLAFLTHELEIACLKKSNSQIQDLFKFASAELDQAAGIIKAHLVNMKATPSGGQ
jgi:HPt (histidine-containing phosphotransfer) domain-containing protein